MLRVCLNLLNQRTVHTHGWMTEPTGCCCNQQKEVRVLSGERDSQTEGETCRVLPSTHSKCFIEIKFCFKEYRTGNDPPRLQVLKISLS